MSLPSRWVLAGLLSLWTLTGAAAPLKVCFVSGSFEYDSDTALAIFQEYLESRYEVEVTMLKAESWTEIPGLEAIDDCDVALFYTRRLLLSGEDLDYIKDYVRSRPIVAIRTASHGFQADLEFDAEVLGGSYAGHFGEGPATEVDVLLPGRDHPILEGVGRMRSQYSLYRTNPVAEDAVVLLRGKTPFSEGSQSIAWTRERNGQRVFYSSLGGIRDFKGASFRRMIAQGLFWAADRPVARKPLPELTPRPAPEGAFTFTVRTREEDAASEWREGAASVRLPLAAAAIVVCDMWDKHWCGFASARVDEMAPRADEVLRAARAAGIRIIHAPSGTMGYYQDTEPRRRAQSAPVAVPPDGPRPEAPPLPIDDSDEGCPDDDVQYSAWSRQHPAIEIDPADVVSDDGREIYNVLADEGIEHIIFLGVHTNMCILNRSFAIRQMTYWGKQCYLVRDLTDSMYNPAMPPFVSHDEGTELVVQYIEKHWAPSLLSGSLLEGLSAE